MVGVAVFTVVDLSGEYDITRREELDKILDRYGDAEPLALNLEAVETMDTSAVRSLVRFQRARKEAGRSPVVLLKPSAKVLQFFDIADLRRSFEIREEA